MKRIELKFCAIVYNEEGCTTYFRDGTKVEACPHPEMPHYYVVAHRCGYQDDILAYCREHEVCHELVAEYLTGTPSDVLWQLAHGKQASRYNMVAEEALAQMLQRFVRANERPIISGVDWDGMKAMALEMLDGA